jgi:hypothetical protein
MNASMNQGLQMEVQAAVTLSQIQIIKNEIQMIEIEWKNFWE